MRLCALVAGLILFVPTVLGGCDSQPQRNPFAPPPDAPKQPPPITELPKPPGPPQLRIDSLSPLVGFTRVLLNKPSDRDKLRAELEKNRKYLSSGDVPLAVSGDARIEMVSIMVQQLSALGASTVTVTTPTRPEYSNKLTLVPVDKLGTVPPCSVVVTILADRGTAVWPLKGGTAAKRRRGFGGPDVTMTGETIERIARGCKESDTLLFTGAEGVQWALVFELAVSTLKLEKTHFHQFVLLREPPTAGRRVRL
ncbi:MAG: hypothetical protein JW940_31405 [Polyangiaceae bacterium]|nr:hypothetical protein [Polyangiaceae bacterium]